MTIQQISVFLENRAGQLAEITGILAEHNIDLRAIHIAETTDYGVLRMIASRPQEAVNILLNSGCVLSMTRRSVSSERLLSCAGLSSPSKMTRDACP